MPTERNGLAYFTESVNLLIEGKLILVDKHIASVLKCVATVPALCRCLSETLKTSAYVTEFSRARVTLTRPDGNVEAKLRLPADRNRLFAFVVCLLTEVDSGRRNFIDFLKEYYYDSDSNISYERFVIEALKPFKRAGENILKSVDPESLDLEAQERAEKYFYAEKIYVNSETLRTVLSLTEDARSLLEKEMFKSEAERVDALNVCNALTNALQLKNPRILRLVWIAFKNTLSQYASLKDSLLRIGNILTQLNLV